MIFVRQYNQNYQQQQSFYKTIKYSITFAAVWIVGFKHVEVVYGFIPTSQVSWRIDTMSKTSSSSLSLPFRSLYESSLLSSTSNDGSKMSGTASIDTTGTGNAIQDVGEDTTMEEEVGVEEVSHEEFLAQCKVLCEERNLKFNKVKNARDLATAAKSTIRPGRLFRMGRVSDATQADIRILLQELNIQTLVDLRSPTEWKDDPTLLRDEVFANFTSMLWKERQAGKPGCLKELLPGQSPVKKGNMFWNKGGSSSHTKGHHDDDDNNEDNEVDKLEAAIIQEKAVVVTEDDAVVFEDEEECTLDCEDPDMDLTSTTTETSGSVVATPAIRAAGGARRERHFVSLMNEFKYVKGTVSKVRKRDITKAIIKAPGAVFSRRVRASLKKPFLDEINGGGLPMLNELLLRFGAPGIKYVLELCSDRSRHPIAFYCTAGKDRTGIISAIIYSLCGVPEESIVEDYTLSANVYAEMNDHKAMVGALSQRNLDAKTFLGAPAFVMRDTLAAIKEQYGSVEGYCDYIGFTKDQQEQLRKACMDV